MYTSTGYCCCDEPEVEEKFYPLNLNPHDIIHITKSATFTDEIVNKITAEYVFFKLLILLSSYYYYISEGNPYESLLGRRSVGKATTFLLT